LIGSGGWGASLIRSELIEGMVRPGGIVVQQVFGQHLAQVVLVDDQQPVEDLAAAWVVLLVMVTPRTCW
jgi:hypothetical protein